MFYSSSTTRTLAMGRSYRQLDRESAAAADLALQEDPRAVRDEIAQRDLLALEPDARRARARQVEQAVRHIFEPIHVLARGVDERSRLGIRRELGSRQQVGGHAQ